jgi:HEAT repeat protein
MIASLALILAQAVGARVAAAPDGTVRLTFATRPGVCGNGRNIIALECHDGKCGHQTISTWGGFYGDEVDYDCDAGPARLSLTVRHGAVESLRTYVGGRWVTPAPGASVTDLGAVSAREAADFLLGLARREGGRAGEEAIFPATIADSVTVWPALLQLARDDRVTGRTRSQAVFWLGQAAGAAAAGDLAGLASDGDLDREVKNAAVFALSQLPHDAGVPLLIRIARTNKDPEVRKKAIFWLGQSGDPRALALFEELLTKP